MSCFPFQVSCRLTRPFISLYMQSELRVFAFVNGIMLFVLSLLPPKIGPHLFIYLFIYYVYKTSRRTRDVTNDVNVKIHVQ